jgi:hypothetical protein
MTKSAHALEAAPELDEAITDEPATPASPTPAEPVVDSGIRHLRTIDSAALRLWSTKAPKEVGGVISAVFLQDAAKVVYLHQWPNGKFAVYEKVA